MSDYDEAKTLFEPHPAYGRYVSHHPSRRLMLLLRSGVVYALGVLLLQTLFFNVPDTVASIFLPMAFAAIAAAALWYVIHLWNREVILYEKGFTYREGSRIGQFWYADIHGVRQNIEQIGLGGLHLQTRYRYHMTSKHDEHLTINNVYSDTRQLINRLDKFIARERLPELQTRLQQGDKLRFGDAFTLSQEGIEYDGRKLAWNALQAVRVRGGVLTIASTDQAQWAGEPVPEIENVVILIGMIKALSPRLEAPTQSAPAAEGASA